MRRTTTIRQTATTTLELSGGHITIHQPINFTRTHMKSDLTLNELLHAYFTCRKTKRYTAAALEFQANLRHNIMELHDELITNTYKPGRSICFVVETPKIREVWASNFRDRIVHHAIYNRYATMFYNSFIHDSYACIPRKGTLRAADRVHHFMRSCSENNTKDAWYMKADVANFFMSIDKPVLDTILTKKISDQWWLNLTRIILHHNPKDDVYIKSSNALMRKVPQHKSLWYTKPGVGLPIGNLSSQLFANIYMNELDQYAKHTLKLKYYARYVDDIIVISNSGGDLHEKYEKLSQFAAEKLKLTFHPNKKEINKIEHGVNFVGYIIKPHTKYIRNSTLVNLYAKMDAKFPSVEKERAVINSYFGMLKHSNGYNERVRFKNKYQHLKFDNKLAKVVL